jgi:hypothetical protein
LAGSHDESSSLQDGESLRSVGGGRERVIGRGPGGIFFQVDVTQQSIMPVIPSSNSFFLPVGFVLLFLPLAMSSLVLFKQSRSIIRNVINSNELDILIGRSAGGEPSVVRLNMQGEPQCLQPVRMNRFTRSWYDPLQYIKQEMKRRIRRELRSLSENTPIFPWLTHLRVSILFVARTDKDIDNTLKPFLDVLAPYPTVQNPPRLGLYAIAGCCQTQFQLEGGGAHHCRRHH